DDDEAGRPRRELAHDRRGELGVEDRVVDVARGGRESREPVEARLLMRDEERVVPFAPRAKPRGDLLLRGPDERLVAVEAGRELARSPPPRAEGIPQDDDRERGGDERANRGRHRPAAAGGRGRKP